MQIIITNSSKDPIYEQIATQVKNLIMDSTLKEGDALPSMRQLAKDLQVSIITTKRAYEELEKGGFIYSIVGKGSFVSEQSTELMKEKRLQTIEENMFEIISNSKMLGIQLEELIEMLTFLYKEEVKQ
ncbi:GntR family transcriptional regulator [Ureibacillus aquaedulcis]|uniref:GntR family transcriptional regulator n=1 Tax=Ureibacillus aquaedulcis TaxID=3058421 RepID=A0ABT8GVU3_9BACL|nr:GntR family transcriptional regulator [Ureibacillus sp. BA0131]MDN4495527.1 GntR family transcriptional regulator [Ureibacillus sp. BA0131]